MTQFDPRVAPLTQLVETMSDPQPTYYGKAAGPRFERNDGVVTLYRLDDIVKLNRNPAVLGTGGGGGLYGRAAALIPLEIDGDDHVKWRRILDPLFSPKQVARLENKVRARARELISAFVSAGETELMASFCIPLPGLTFLELVGAPVADLDYFLRFKDGILKPEGDTLEEMQSNMARVGLEFTEYCQKFLMRRRAETEQAEDITALLLRSEIEGQPIQEEDLINILFLLIFAGLDTVTASLGCMFRWLGENQGERTRLVADPTRIPAAVEELLRFESPVPSAVRFASDDVDLGDGLVIRRGEAIHAIWATANLDPHAIERPLEVDFDRGRTHHLAFASGTHRCLGSHLARLELRIAIEEMLAAIPDFSVPEPVDFGNTAVRAPKALTIGFTAPSHA